MATSRATDVTSEAKTVRPSPFRPIPDGALPGRTTMAAPKKAKKAVKAKPMDDAYPEMAPARTPAPAASRRVLLVDDDAEITESMKAVLESRGYEILVARDGNQEIGRAHV